MFSRLLAPLFDRLFGKRRPEDDPNFGKPFSQAVKDAMAAEIVDPLLLPYRIVSSDGLALIRGKLSAATIASGGTVSVILHSAMRMRFGIPARLEVLSKENEVLVSWPVSPALAEFDTPMTLTLTY